MKIKTLDRPFQIKSIATDGTFKGHASVFGEIDSYRDIVMPGAFKETLKRDYEAKDRKVPMLWQHNSWEPIGVYTELKEDDIGLYVEGELNMEVQKGREAHALMKQGAISGLSIGYATVDFEIDNKAQVRKLKAVDLWEISPVTFPAGDSARISSVKTFAGFTTLSECEDALRDAGFSSKEAATLIARIKALAPMSDSAEAKSADIQAALSILRQS